MKKTYDKPLDSMSKDELLDATALLGIKADYTMTVKELILLLKSHKEEELTDKAVKLTKQQVQDAMRTRY